MDGDIEVQDDLAHLISKEQISLHTHMKINTNFSGEVVTINPGYAKVVLDTLEVMRADEIGMVHGGFIFGAADFAAMAAVNEPNVVLASCTCLFLSPVRVGDQVTFIAEEHQQEGRKRTVQVKGFVYDIKVFEGEFKTIITDRHVLRLDLLKNTKELDREV
ncbi:MAG: hotdog domain-containing protein [Sulfuricurvum sp.]|nr:hotdog domain-containing protein [Sulfuricurvum sp.]MDP3022057.1 hotdog domain-containing protein [Sulfuricurvum sp.]MDP3120427.1 hotdog domain-containing protein [Sulfuricurvum sp.]